MARLETLPSSLAKTLEDCPVKGERNVWLMQIASRAQHVASPQRVREFLLRIASDYGWTDRDFSHEIDRAIARAYGTNSSCRSSKTTLSRSSSTKSESGWPRFDQTYWDLCKDHEPLFDLQRLEIDPSFILDSLYPPDALICAALDIRSAVTAPREHWRGKEAAMQFIVTNPMSSLTGTTQEGKPSNRCHTNATLSRTFQVIEFDRGTPVEQQGILSSLHNPERTPLIMVVWSGGKSMHGWFDVRRLTEDEKIEFFSWACTVGADSSLWDPCKLVRMPGGRRSNGNTQPVLDFQPHLLLE